MSLPHPLHAVPKKRRPAAGGTPRPIAQLESLLTMEQAGGFLGVTTRTIERLVATGELPVVRISSRCVRFRPEDLRTYVEGKLCR